MDAGDGKTEGAGKKLEKKGLMLPHKTTNDVGQPNGSHLDFKARHFPATLLCSYALKTRMYP